MESVLDNDDTIQKNKLLCPICFLEIDIELILKNSTVSWPYKNWIYFLCPKCKGHSHIELSNNMIKTGELDGAPGPTFVPCSQLFANDLFVDKKSDMLLCEYKGVIYQFPAR